MMPAMPALVFGSVLASLGDESPGVSSSITVDVPGEDLHVLERLSEAARTRDSEAPLSNGASSSGISAMGDVDETPCGDGDAKTMCAMSTVEVQAKYLEIGS